jgi:hypothetical protein
MREIMIKVREARLVSRPDWSTFRLTPKTDEIVELAKVAVYYGGLYATQDV